MSETTICFEKTGEFRLPHPFEYWLFEGEVLHGISPAGPDQRREILQRKDMPNVTTLLATAKASNTTLRAQLSTLTQQLADSQRRVVELEAKFAFLRLVWFEQLMEHIVVGEDCKLSINCSDCFPGGHTDCEPIERDDFRDFWQAVKDCELAGDDDYGPLLWCARKRRRMVRANFGFPCAIAELFANANAGSE